MKEPFVTYEIASKLKNLGFDNILCFGYYTNKGEYLDTSKKYHKQQSIDDLQDKCLAPLWQQVIDWIREKYNISLEIFTLSYHNSIQYCFNIKKLEYTTITVLYKGNVYYPSYYEAREQGILKAIELCKKH